MANQVLRAVQMIQVGLKRLGGRLPVRLLPRPHALPRKAPPVSLFKIFDRRPALLRNLRRIGNLHSRAFLNAVWQRQGELGQRDRHSTLGWRSLAAHRESTLLASLAHIREPFYRQPPREGEALPRTLAGYDLGSFIDKGCNAAVYEARVRDGIGRRSHQHKLLTLNQVSVLRQPDTLAQTGIHTRNNAATAGQHSRLQQRKEKYPLAVKMLFNYHFGTRDEAILRAASKELVPATTADIRSLLRREKGLREASPFVVALYTSFVGEMPILPGAEEHYPNALPAHDLFQDRYGQDRTLFVVMKRYTMTLHQYLRQYVMSGRSGCVLLAQLLEGIRHLGAEGIAHRDLKSNNVLLEFNHPDETPHLVLSDFGCCLSGSLRMAYTSGADLGGNLELRSPEIRNAAPGAVLDYGKADVWAAATLGYEIFTGSNPFYHRLSSASYSEEDLPQLPSPVPKPIRRLLSSLLRRDPVERAEASTAAAVSALALFRGAEIPPSLSALSGARLWKKIKTALELYAVETILAGSEIRRRTAEMGGAYFGEEAAFSDAEVSLRRHFLARLETPQLIPALPFFFQE